MTGFHLAGPGAHREQGYSPLAVRISILNRHLGMSQDLLLRAAPLHFLSSTCARPLCREQAQRSPTPSLHLVASAGAELRVLGQSRLSTAETICYLPIATRTHPQILHTQAFVKPLNLTQMGARCPPETRIVEAAEPLKDFKLSMCHLAE